MTDPSSAQPPRFLADRCLGRVTIDRLRTLGWDIVRLGELQSNDAQTTSDEELVAIAAANGWSVLTKDKRIRLPAVVPKRWDASLRTLRWRREDRRHRRPFRAGQGPNLGRGWRG